MTLPNKNHLLLLAIIVALMIPLEASAMFRDCIFSEVTGQIFHQGKPLPDARIRRIYEYKSKEEDSTRTDARGHFTFPAVWRNSLSSLFPGEFVVAQNIVVEHQGKEYKIWSNTKRSANHNAELGGAPLQLTCEITDDWVVYREFGSILRTNCRFGTALTANRQYLFSEHLDSVEWLEKIPKSVLTNTVDLTYSTVSINRIESGYLIYVGPITPEKGGSAVSVFLDPSLGFQRYEIEHLAPIIK